MRQDKRHVVVVDDDESVRRSLDRLLRSAGYDVTTYASAEALFANDSPDLPACAVLDLAMPGLNGLEIQARIVSEELPYGVVFLTGHGNLEAGVDAMKHGAADFLTKPVDETRLLAAVERALNDNLTAVEIRTEAKDAESRFSQLTQRESEVMEHVVAGRLNKQIAADLDISEKTVKAHRAQVMRKSRAGSLAELVRLHMHWQRPDD